METAAVVVFVCFFSAFYCNIIMVARVTPTLVYQKEQQEKHHRVSSSIISRHTAVRNISHLERESYDSNRSRVESSRGERDWATVPSTGELSLLPNWDVLSPIPGNRTKVVRGQWMLTHSLSRTLTLSLSGLLACFTLPYSVTFEMFHALALQHKQPILVKCSTNVKEPNHHFYYFPFPCLFRSSLFCDRKWYGSLAMWANVPIDVVHNVSNVTISSSVKIDTLIW